MAAALPLREQLLAVFLGGALGTLARAGLAEAVVAEPGCWPWATLVANLVAVVALAFVVAWRRTSMSGWWRPFLATGLCGGLSTFSTLQLELLRMLDAGSYGLALAYAATSIVLGLVAVAVTVRLTERAFA